ncbi:MAG: MarR family transcriptional regulator [Dehalococcoidia bacterium]|nr:MarR family transcriptional regulator [Dehalococcoidia bacterium]
MARANNDIEEAIRLLIRAAGSLEGPRIDRWEDLGLTVPQRRVLVFFRDRPGATAGAIAQHLGVSPYTVTGLVDRLARTNLVRRLPDGADGRVVRARLTDEEAHAVAGLDEAGRERLTAMLRAMDGPRLQQLRRALEELIQAPGAENPDPSDGSSPVSWRVPLLAGPRPVATGTDRC